MTTVNTSHWWPGDRHDPLSDLETQLLAALEQRFAVEAVGLPGWDDPLADPKAQHGRREAREEEYSRITDPGRFDLVLARGRAWTSLLVELGWARAVEVTDPDWEGDDPVSWALLPWRWRNTGSLTVLSPLAEDAVPLLFWNAVGDGVDGANITVCAGNPAIALDFEIPDCRCDACDSGSQDLLQMIDQAVLGVVGGALEAEVDDSGRRVRSKSTNASSTNDQSPLYRRPARVVARPWSPDLRPPHLPS